MIACARTASECCSPPTSALIDPCSNVQQRGMSLRMIKPRHLSGVTHVGRRAETSKAERRAAARSAKDRHAPSAPEWSPWYGEDARRASARSRRCRYARSERLHRARGAGMTLREVSALTHSTKCRCRPRGARGHRPQLEPGGIQCFPEFRGQQPRTARAFSRAARRQLKMLPS